MASSFIWFTMAVLLVQCCAQSIYHPRSDRAFKHVSDVSPLLSLSHPMKRSAAISIPLSSYRPFSQARSFTSGLSAINSSPPTYMLPKPPVPTYLPPRAPPPTYLPPSTKPPKAYLPPIGPRSHLTSKSAGRLPSTGLSSLRSADLINNRDITRSTAADLFSSLTGAKNPMTFRGHPGNFHPTTDSGGVKSKHRPQVDSGKYHPSDESGRYKPVGQSGQYTPGNYTSVGYKKDKSGQYVSDESGRYFANFTEHLSSGDFDFGYAVRDNSTGTDFAVHETEHGGAYRTLLPDGRYQIITYYIDPNGIYRTAIHYQSAEHKPSRSSDSRSSRSRRDSV